MNYKKVSFASIVLATGLFIGATPTNAALRVTTNTSVTAGTPILKLDTAAKTKANAQITARIAALKVLQARIAEMKKVSATQKAELHAMLENSVTDMTNLKAKIDADTDGTELKTDIQSLTKSYRIYVLVLPQGRITAAGDRVLTITNLFSDLEVKLRSRIDAAAAAGADVSALKLKLADFTAKYNDASAEADAAIAEVANLKPDNGDQVVFKANADILKDARVKIRVAMTDLKTARQDAGSIVKTLASLTTNTITSTDITTK